MTELRDGVDGDEDGALWAAVAAHSLPSVRLSGDGPCEPSSRGTRLGGDALAGDGFGWPCTDGGRPLSVLAQLECDAVNATLGRDALPGGALLTFFYDAAGLGGWGYDPGDRQYWRVLVSDAATARAVPAQAETFTAIGCAARRVRTIPERWEPPVEALWGARRGGVNRFYDRVGQPAGAPRHRVFGWPEPVQHPMRLDCQLASNGVFIGGPEGYGDPRVEQLRAGAADWVLLLQLDCDDDVGWAWGDAGTLYYWIRRQDLAAGDFSRIWGIGQCC